MQAVRRQTPGRTEKRRLMRFLVLPSTALGANRLRGHYAEARVRTNRSIPSATVIPVLIYPDVRAAVEWLTNAFGFSERLQIGEDHLADPWGHQWTFSEMLEDVDPASWGGILRAR